MLFKGYGTLRIPSSFAVRDGITASIARQTGRGKQADFRLRYREEIAILKVLSGASEPLGSITTARELERHGIVLRESRQIPHESLR